MKKNLIHLFALVACGALLASCGTTDNPTSSVSSNETSSSIQEIPSSSEPVVTTFKVVVRASNGVTIEADKERAAMGETVTLRVTLANGYSLTGIFLNGNASAITKVSETVYTFVMPDTSAVITTTVAVEGDCVSVGDLAVALTRQADGTYKGNVEFENAGDIVLKVGSVIYGWDSLNFNTSFGDISNGRKIESITGFHLAGNAKYEVIFNPADEKPVTFYRNGAFHAPLEEKELLQILNNDYAGRVPLDRGTFNIRNLTGVSYKNNKTMTQYDWHLYENGASFATAQDLVEEDTAYVYKGIEDGKFVVVDNYIEAQKDDLGNWYDDTARNDIVAYSGVKSIDDAFDASSDLYRTFKISSSDAEAEIAMPSHNMYSLSREIMRAYRVGLTVEDEVVAANTSWQASTNENGEYEVTIFSWKNVDENASLYSSGTEVAHITYDLKLVFNADTTVKTCSYTELKYSDKQWNFDNKNLETGGTPMTGVKGSTVRKATWTYTYDTKAAGAPDFDKTPYFVSSVSNVHATSKGHAEDHVQQGDVIDNRRYPEQQKQSDDHNYGYSEIISFDYAPATALDVWQYGVTSSSNADVVRLENTYGWGWYAKQKGTTTLTVGNRVDNKVTATSGNITVENDVAPTGYYIWEMADTDDSVKNTSSSMNIYAGDIIDIYLWASPTNAGTAPRLTTSNENLKATLVSGLVTPEGPTSWSIARNPTYIMRVDASKMSVTEKTSCKIFVSDPATTKVSEISVTVKPGTGSYAWPSTLVGTTWVGDEAYTEAKAQENGYNSGVHCDSRVTFTNEDITVRTNGVSAKKAILTATVGSRTRTFNLGYVYNPASNRKIEFYSTDMSQLLGYTIERQSGYFGLYLTVSTWAGGDDIESDDIVGYPETDSDVALYQYFKIAA